MRPFGRCGSWAAEMLSVWLNSTTMGQDGGHWIIIHVVPRKVGCRTKPRRAKSQKILGLADKFGINIDACDGRSLKFKGWKVDISRVE